MPRHDLWLFIDGKQEMEDAIKKLDRDLKRQLFTKKHSKVEALSIRLAHLGSLTIDSALIYIVNKR